MVYLAFFHGHDLPSWPQLRVYSFLFAVTLESTESGGNKFLAPLREKNCVVASQREKALRETGITRWCS
jgi:hypothetical protein